jgi:hypothetical protein
MIHKKVTISLCVIILVVFCVIFLTSKLQKTNSENHHGTALEQNHAPLLNPSEQSDIKSGKIKPRSQNPNVGSIEKLIEKSYYNIISSLRNDEATRSKLISKEESEDRYIYKFAISPRNDFDQYINELVTKESINNRINASAITQSLDQMVDMYKIPKDEVQIVTIQVPKNITEDPSSMTVNVPLEDINKPLEQMKLRGRMMSVRVKPKEKDWRYNNLLELDANQAK